MQTAFEQIRRYARDGNQRLTDVARHVVEGQLDPTGLRHTRAHDLRTEHHDR